MSCLKALERSVLRSLTFASLVSISPSRPSNCSAPVKPAIEINPARNGGKSYHFKEVVRNKEARKHMHAHTCEGCAGVSVPSTSGFDRRTPSHADLPLLQYYEADQRPFDHAANCKGSGKGQGKGKARGPAPKGNHFLDERHRQMEARLQKTSRHRAQHKRKSPTPLKDFEYSSTDISALPRSRPRAARLLADG